MNERFSRRIEANNRLEADLAGPSVFIIMGRFDLIRLLWTTNDYSHDGFGARIRTENDTCFFEYRCGTEQISVVRSDPPLWVGYDAVFELIESLRAKLTGKIGEAPKFGWYFRTDPQSQNAFFKSLIASS